MMQPPSFNSSNAASELAAALEADHRPRPPASPTAPPAEPSWLSANREVAEAVLEDAKREPRPAHRAIFKFISLPFCHAANPLLMDLLALRSFSDAKGREVPAGPQLLFVISPKPGVHSSLDLLRMLSHHPVEHLITLGDLPISWLPTSGSSHRSYAVNNGIEPILLAETSHAQRCGNGWSSTLALRSSTPAGDGSTLAKTVQRLHVPAHGVDLLPPESLQTVVDWVKASTPPGGRVAFMATHHTADQTQEYFPLSLMRHQVALAMALRQHASQSGCSDPHAQAVRQQLLADAASELYGRGRQLFGGPSQLSAVLEADRLGPAGIRGERPRAAWPVSPMGPVHPATPAQPLMPASAEAVPTPETHSSAADIRSDEVIAINELPPRDLARPSRIRFE